MAEVYPTAVDWVYHHFTGIEQWRDRVNDPHLTQRQRDVIRLTLEVQAQIDVWRLDLEKARPLTDRQYFWLSVHDGMRDAGVVKRALSGQPNPPDTERSFLVALCDKGFFDSSMWVHQWENAFGSSGDALGTGYLAGALERLLEREDVEDTRELMGCLRDHLWEACRVEYVRESCSQVAKVAKGDPGWVHPLEVERARALLAETIACKIENLTSNGGEGYFLPLGCKTHDSGVYFYPSYKKMRITHIDAGAGSWTPDWLDRKQWYCLGVMSSERPRAEAISPDYFSRLMRTSHRNKDMTPVLQTLYGTEQLPPQPHPRNAFAAHVCRWQNEGSCYLKYVIRLIHVLAADGNLQGCDRMKALKIKEMLLEEVISGAAYEMPVRISSVMRSRLIQSRATQQMLEIASNESDYLDHIHVLMRVAQGSAPDLFPIEVSRSAWSRFRELKRLSYMILDRALRSDALPERKCLPEFVTLMYDRRRQELDRLLAHVPRVIKPSKRRNRRIRRMMELYVCDKVPAYRYRFTKACIDAGLQSRNAFAECTAYLSVGDTAELAPRFIAGLQ